MARKARRRDSSSLGRCAVARRWGEGGGSCGLKRARLSLMSAPGWGRHARTRPRAVSAAVEAKPSHDLSLTLHTHNPYTRCFSG